MALPTWAPSTVKTTEPLGVGSWMDSVPLAVVIVEWTVPVTTIVIECPLYEPVYGVACDQSSSTCPSG